MSSITRRTFLLAGCAGACAWALPALAQSQGRPQTPLPFQTRGVLRAGVSVDIPGMGFKDPRSGRIEGFEADLARAVAAIVLGSPERVVFVPVSDAERIPFLKNDRVDMVLAQLTITPERLKQVDFSVPYITTYEALLVPRRSAIRRFEDLKGKRIVVAEGSVSQIRMQASLPSLPGATLVALPLTYDGFEAVQRGQADAASNDLINLAAILQGAPDRNQYRIIDIGSRFPAKPFGIAVKKGSPALVSLLNQAIDRLRAQGDIDRLMKVDMSTLP